MTEKENKPSNIQIPARGPIFISNIYPVTEFKRELFDTIESIDDAYSFWGKTLPYASTMLDKSFFPAPLSYPYKFSENGLSVLKSELANIPQVDKSSITEKSFPNIPSDKQYIYGSHDMENYLINENYISFKLKYWSDIEFMKFPTFVVIRFDYSNKKIDSIQDYRNLASGWQSLTNELNKLESLKYILGISRNRNVWVNVPILVFVAMGTLDDAEYHNRYFAGRETPIQRRSLFLKEVSLRGHSHDTSALRLTGCHRITYEHTTFPPSIWRFYYTRFPYFSVDDSSMEVGELVTSRATLGRILRTALFTHVTLPSLSQLSEDINVKLTKRLTEIQSKRMKSFGNFSYRQLQEFHKYLSGNYEWYKEIVKEIDMVKEAQRGYEELIRDIENTFNPTVFGGDLMFKRNIDSANVCRKLFEFDDSGRVINDRSKAKGYAKEITSRIKSLETSHDVFRKELLSFNELIEARKNIFESKVNTILAIIIPALGAVVFGGIFYWILYRS